MHGSRHSNTLAFAQYIYIICESKHLSSLILIQNCVYGVEYFNMVLSRI